MGNLAHIRVFWFGIMIGWITSAEFPYDKFAFSYYLDILTHICDIDSIPSIMKGIEDGSSRAHVALETLEACVDRLSGDVIPEENLVNNSFVERTSSLISIIMYCTVMKVVFK